MEIKYTVIEATDEKPQFIWAELDDGRVLCIPTDPTNSDYQAYLNRDNDPKEL